MSKKKKEEVTIAPEIASEPTHGTSTLPKVVQRRLEQLYFTMEENKVDSIAVTYMPNIRYMTRFSGSAATLFLTPKKTVFVTDDRYELNVKDELYDLPNLEIHITRDVWEYLAKKQFLGKISSIGFESDWVSYHAAVEIRNVLRPIKFKPAENMVERFTQPKAEEELENIKKSAEIAEKVYEKILAWVQPGMTENEISTEITYQARLMGSEYDAFPPIVTSGHRTVIIHGKPTDKKIRKNELVLVNFGCSYNGFLSDITRMFVIGKASKEQIAIYSTLQDAKKAAIEGVCPGMNGKNLDKLSRSIIKDAGYNAFFQHSLGHGIGLVRYEKPLITFRKTDQIVPEDCVLVIEPGIYLPDRFGIRVSEEILVTRNGGVNINNAPNEISVV